MMRRRALVLQQLVELLVGQLQLFGRDALPCYRRSVLKALQLSMSLKHETERIGNAGAREPNTDRMSVDICRFVCS